MVIFRKDLYFTEDSMEYLPVDMACDIFSHLLVYFLNMHGAIEPFLLLVRTLKRSTLLSRNNKHIS